MLWLLLLVLALPPGRSGTSQILLCLRESPFFELRYVHSVERTPVVETYRIQGGRLVLVGMRFRSVGWGLPSEGYVRQNGWFVVSGLHRPLGALRLRVMRLNRYLLVAERQTLPLLSLAGEGGVLVLSAGRVPGCTRVLRIVRA
ncbi:MAG: DUF1850 domain-containing protein [Armatimonadota bacterium]|nr:DUF1850 domain-containing protein [Armatimonadota bacterium]MDR7439282.1 DUF1850 domain-containing protein [Armatimonadota bacterium]MDR7562059.1 DUF1850 domain-containing protein [Armatimonadota bacterium]MDR7567271.1 DUF1850 domain-containing protein [Armatimonadota bacterium]MDR7601114.1 DUF1850 domain-containing protein [Armatimonadota bacterium]